MSTTATAPHKFKEQPGINRWLEYIGEDDARFLADRLRAETRPVKPSSPVDLDRVESLLNHLEARSKALAKYTYAHSPQPSRPAASKVALVAVLLALWLSVLGFFFIYVRLTNGKQPIQQGLLTGRPIVSPMHPRELRKAAGSFDHLAKTLASSSKSLNHLEAELERSKKSLQSIANRAATDSPDAATTSNTLSTGTSLADAIGVRQIQPSDLAIPHKTTDGLVDYWLMPRGPRGGSPAKVFSIGKVAGGVVVLNLQDNKYYTVTQAGEWRGIRIPRLAN